MNMRKEEETQQWQQYQNGIEYKRQINLYNTVNKNERMYDGNQWDGVNSNGLPTPVFNVIKRAIQYKVSAISSDNVKMQFGIEGIGDVAENDNEAELKEVARLLSEYSDTNWERLKMNFLNGNGLKDASLSGDYVLYFYWDPTIKTGTEVEGDINAETIDNVNLFLGNPNDSRINYSDKPIQPYILVAFRQLVGDLQREAEASGMSKAEVEKITSDLQTSEQAGDLANIELNQSKKTIALLKLWYNKETGTIWANKSTKTAIIKKDYDTKLTLYPVALMNWETRKNCCHGQAECTNLIPNQIFINKAFAMAMLNVMYYAFPKAIYDSTRIKKWTNLVGSSIPVAGDISGAAQFLTPGQAATQDLYKLIDMAISYTKELMGATEAALGEVRPENTSAIIAVQKAAAIPLEMIKERFYNFIEDVGRIWLDFWLNYYNVPRKLKVNRDGQELITEINLSNYKDYKFNLKIDVGASTQWSEIASIQTLDNLLMNQHITFVEYLERIPRGIVPQSQELITAKKAQEEQMQQMAQMQEVAQQEQQMPIRQMPMQEIQQAEIPNQEEVMQEVLGSLSEEQLQQLQENPEILQQLFGMQE